MKVKTKAVRQGSHIQRRVGFADDYAAAHEASHLPQTELDAALVAGDPEKGKRFRASPDRSHLVRKPHLAALLGSAYITAWEELSRLEGISRERQLDEAEVRRYTHLVDSLSKLAKTEREANAEERMEDMDQKELLEKARDAIKLLGEDDEV